MDEEDNVAEIAYWARELVKWRDEWLNPPREGMYLGLGDAYEKMLQKRTLTNLYNDRPTWLDNAHRKLDQAVCSAYARATGDPVWRPDMTDEEILEKLLALNLERGAPVSSDQ